MCQFFYEKLTCSIGPSPKANFAWIDVQYRESVYCYRLSNVQTEEDLIWEMTDM